VSFLACHIPAFFTVAYWCAIFQSYFSGVAFFSVSQLSVSPETHNLLECEQFTDSWRLVDACQVWEAGHNAEECSEDQAGAGAVDGWGRGAVQERDAELDGLHRQWAVEETKTSHVVHASGTRSTQRILWAQHTPFRLDFTSHILSVQSLSAPVFVVIVRKGFISLLKITAVMYYNSQITENLPQYMKHITYDVVEKMCSTSKGTAEM